MEGTLGEITEYARIRAQGDLGPRLRHEREFPFHLPGGSGGGVGYPLQSQCPASVFGETIALDLKLTVRFQSGRADTGDGEEVWGFLGSARKNEEKRAAKQANFSPEKEKSARFGGESGAHPFHLMVPARKPQFYEKDTKNLAGNISRNRLVEPLQQGRA